MEKRKGNILFALYFIVVSFFLASRMLGNEMNMIIFKSIRTFLLLLTYYLFTKRFSVNYLFILSIMYIGDIIFVFEGFDTFLSSVGFYFLSNLTLSFFIYSKTVQRNTGDFQVFLTPFLMLILLLVYVIFSALKFPDMLIITYSCSMLLLLVTSFIYYNTKLKKSSFWFVCASSFLLASAVFTGFDKLMFSHKVFGLIDSLSYSAAVLFICFAFVNDEKEKIEAQKNRKLNL